MLADLREYDSYEGDKLNISVYNGWLSAESSAHLFNHILKNAHWSKSTVSKGRRNKVIYGDPSIKSYEIMYRGERIVTHVRPWSDMPILEQLGRMIKTQTGQTYHTCVIQFYPDGNSGIKPHRDKEMVPKTIIASVSLGSTRKMRFGKSGSSSEEDQIDIPLSSGTLCLINPPTNDYWLHSIPVSRSNCSNTPRISLVYRNTITYA